MEYSSLHKVQRYSARSGRHWTPTSSAATSLAADEASTRPAVAAQGGGAVSAGCFLGLGLVRRILQDPEDELASLRDDVETQGTSDSRLTAIFGILGRLAVEDLLPVTRFRSDRRRWTSSPETSAGDWRFRGFLGATSEYMLSSPESLMSCESSVTTHGPRNDGAQLASP
eukprot:CAMPEP_0197415004 /NCGR_PEP_ID=MMETSP1170-20131217/1612_1 /TAXON_ID=54406 /ORGANISM="Sarcinochrysis sp, Strain CCMP770" /LENGTH=169 /DNA_ID=CAMNT_0042941763 /DNA_START=20 /DNA_END=525 /DNA_ORIENTATION=-